MLTGMNNENIDRNHSRTGISALRRLRLRHLEAFVEVSRQSSVSGAARALNLTQPAVSRTLRELEEICGERLVEREGRGIRVTSYGAAFLAHAGASLAAARSGIATLRELGGQAGPPIRVGALPTVSATLMPRAVAEYLETGLKARLRVVAGENRVLLDQLRNGELDLVMGRLPAPEVMAGLVFEPLYHDHVVFVVHRSHPALASKHPAVEALADYPLLVPPPHSIIRPFVERLFLELGMPEPRATVETVASSFGQAFVRRHPAVWVISRGVVAADLEAGELVTLPIDTRSTMGSVGLVTRAGIALPPATERFAAILRRVASAG